MPFAGSEWLIDVSFEFKQMICFGELTCCVRVECTDVFLLLYYQWLCPVTLHTRCHPSLLIARERLLASDPSLQAITLCLFYVSLLRSADFPINLNLPVYIIIEHIHGFEH